MLCNYRTSVTVLLTGYCHLRCALIYFSEIDIELRHFFFQMDQVKTNTQLQGRNINTLTLTPYAFPAANTVFGRGKNDFVASSVKDAVDLISWFSGDKYDPDPKIVNSRLRIIKL